MKNMRKLRIVVSGFVAAAVIAVGVTSPILAAPKQYVTKIASVKINGTSVKKGGTYTIYRGSKTPTVQVKTSVKTKGNASTKVAYVSTNKKVAVVDKTGKLVSKKAGTTTIKICTRDFGKDGKRIIYPVKVKVKNTSLGIKIDNVKLLRTGTDPQPTATLKVDAKNLDVTVKSDNKSVVKVVKEADGKWTLTGLKEGTAKITIKGVSSGNKATREVTKTVKVTDLKCQYFYVKKIKPYMYIGETNTLRVLMGNPVIGGYKVTSSNPAIASVDEENVIHAEGEGKVTITVSSNDGVASHEYELIVGGKPIQ